MHILLTNLRYAWRRTRSKSGVTLSIILLLALGTGGVTAVFNPIYSTLFSPLPFPQPEQLVQIGGNIPLFRVSTSSFEHEEILGRVFSNTAAYNQYETKIRIPDTDEQLVVNALSVTEDFFEVLGVKLLMGNLKNDQNSVGFIISHRFWQNKLMQKYDDAGSYILSHDGNRLPIIGIMPKGFNFPFDTDIWHWRRSGNYGTYFDRNTNYIGRLRTGISPGAAAEELKSIDSKITIDTLQGTIRRSGNGPILQSLQTSLYGDQRPMLRMLGVAAILFFALVCAGVINLLIAQGARRKQEIATRLVYGASRRNLVFQLLIETLPLAVLGGLTGLWLSEITGSFMWAQMPALRNGAVAVPVKIAFWTMLVMAVTLIGGLFPALYATSLDLNTYLKAAKDGKRRLFSTQEILVGVQLCLALALLIGVGVLVRSIMFNVDIPIGWSSRNIAVVSAIQTRNGNLVSLPELDREIINELNAMPEVETVGIVAPIPFSPEAVRDASGRMIIRETMRTSNIKILGEVDGNLAASVRVDTHGFDALGISLVMGRRFTDIDTTNFIETLYDRRVGLADAAIVNQAFARQQWREENPIGKIFYVGRNAYEVVGVVRNFHHIPASKDFIPTMYIPYEGTITSTEFLVKLRPKTSFSKFHSNARQRLSRFPLDWVVAKPLSEYVKEATVNQRLTIQLLAGFAVLGIIVAALAVYATATLAASARTKEMGIRMAMGAQTWDILKLAFLRGIRAILLGLPFGLFLALILCKVLSSFLVQVNIRDPLVWLISCAVLLVIATVAALIPALRAVFLNPLDALRNE